MAPWTPSVRSSGQGAKNAHRCKELTPVLAFTRGATAVYECMHRLRDTVFGVPADDDPTPDCTLGAGSHSLKGLRSMSMSMSMLSVTYHDLWIPACAASFGLVFLLERAVELDLRAVVPSVEGGKVNQGRHKPCGGDRVVVDALECLLLGWSGQAPPRLLVNDADEHAVHVGQRLGRRSMDRTHPTRHPVDES